MVNVRRKTRARLILLITGTLVAGVTSAHASFWKRGGAAKAPAPSAAASSSVPVAGMSLTAIDVENTPSPRLILRTTASPVYSSYSLMPDLFVIDLTGASKAASLVIPATLPSSVASISVDNVTEVGVPLTRVSVHFKQAATIEASAEGNNVIVNLPVSAPAVVEAVPIQKIDEPVAVVKTPEPAPLTAQVEPEPVKSEPVAEAPVVTEALPPANQAKTLKKIETSGTGSAIQVRLATDGDVAYNAFKLEKPSRVVIDLTGVNDKLAKNVINVSDPVVKRIRVSQFKSAPDAVTRVVLDVDEKSAYRVTKVGDALQITFGNSPVIAAAPAPVPVPKHEEQPRVAATPIISPAEKSISPAAQNVAPVKTAAATDIPAQVPTIAPTVAPAVADNATWKMPEPRKPATSVINSPQTQTPPASKKRRGSKTTTTTAAQETAPPAIEPAVAGENVFTDPQQPQLSPQGQQPQPSPAGGTLLSAAAGGRTLSSGEKSYTGEPLSLNLKDADIKDVLRTFAQLTGLNIAIDPTVSGSVTVDFIDVPWDQALEIILRQNSLAYVLEGNVMRVGTAARLSEEAEANRHLNEQERLNVPLNTVGFKLSYARAQDVANLLREMASPRARIIVDARTNQLIISEIPTYLQTMRNLIESVDVPTRQVVIEARIVETTKLFIQQYGINWGFHGSMDPSLGTGTGLAFPNRIDSIGTFDFGAGNPVLSFSLQNVLGTFTLDLALLAAETEGIVRVISAPRVMTQDNTPAEITSGFQIPYQTRVNFTTTVQYVDATLRLSVTPQITEAGTVIMDIQVQKNEPATGLNVEGGSGTPLSTRRAQTKLMVRDGGTSVIAGIYQVKDNNAQSRMPFVHQIPIIGALFRTRNYNSEHDELLIFITPRIVRSS